MKDFYFDMNMKQGNELRIVIKPGLIRWDTNKENDIENWCGFVGGIYGLR